MALISRRFLKTSFIYTVAGTLPVASAVILLPFYTASLSPASFAALSIYLAFSLLIQYITTYSFDVSLYIHYHEYKNRPQLLARFTSSAFNLMLLIGVVVSAALSVFGELIFRQVFTNSSISFYPYGLLAALTGIAQSLIKVYGNLCQTRDQPKWYLWINLSFFFLIVMFTIAGLELFPQSLTGPIGGRFIAAVIMGGIIVGRTFLEFGVHLDFRLLKKSFSFNFYTFIYQLLQWSVNYLDRFLLVFFIALSDIGLYDFAAKCLLVIEFLLNGLHNSFYPKVVSTIMDQSKKMTDPSINRYYHAFISVIMLLVCICILTFPWAIETFVSREEYLGAIQYIPYLAVIYILRSIRVFFAVPYGILKRAKPLPVIYFVVSLVKVLLVVLFVRDYGIPVVIFASFVSVVVEIVLLRFVLRREFLYRFNSYKILFAPLALLLVIVVSESWLGMISPHLVHMFYLTFCVVILWWAYRNEIGSIIPAAIKDLKR